MFMDLNRTHINYINSNHFSRESDNCFYKWFSIFDNILILFRNYMFNSHYNVNKSAIYFNEDNSTM